MNYERLFQGLAIVLVPCAAFFYWQGQTDAAFVAAVLGAVSFFISIRIQIKDRLGERPRLQEEGEAEVDDIHSSAE
jgi:hypothetical protein